MKYFWWEKLTSKIAGEQCGDVVTKFTKMSVSEQNFNQILVPF